MPSPTSNTTMPFVSGKWGILSYRNFHKSTFAISKSGNLPGASVKNQLHSICTPRKSTYQDFVGISNFQVAVLETLGGFRKSAGDTDMESVVTKNTI